MDAEHLGPTPLTKVRMLSDICRQALERVLAPAPGLTWLRWEQLGPVARASSESDLHEHLCLALKLAPLLALPRRFSPGHSLLPVELLEVNRGQAAEEPPFNAGSYPNV
jgi:hypothetical protein